MKEFILIQRFLRPIREYLCTDNKRLDNGPKYYINFYNQLYMLILVRAFVSKLRNNSLEPESYFKQGIVFLDQEMFIFRQTHVFLGKEMYIKSKYKDLKIVLFR